MSLYWDDFEKRIPETVTCIKNNLSIPIRRVAIFITNVCNFKCSYCNVRFENKSMSEENFEKILSKYGKDPIYHITGGEPSTVKWLYSFLDSHDGYRFHLNTNGLIKPPKNIKRLKVSLDTNEENYFNYIVGKNCFNEVIENIKYACNYTTVSLTCTLTKENYLNAPIFMKWCRENFNNLYAVFFSIYKGNNPRFIFEKEDANIFFDEVVEKLKKEMDEESLNLFLETCDEKQRIVNGIRFPENKLEKPCYLSMSERVIDADGNEFNCSHLYRDGINTENYSKDEKCRYGCNRRLIKFNEEVEKLLEV